MIINANTITPKSCSKRLPFIIDPPELNLFATGFFGSFLCLDYILSYYMGGFQDSYSVFAICYAIFVLNL